MKYLAQRWFLILVLLLILMPGILFTSCGGASDGETSGRGYSAPTMESTAGNTNDNYEGLNQSFEAANLAAYQAALIENVGSLSGYEVYRVYDQETCAVLYIVFWGDELLKTVTPPILLPCYRIGG